MVSDNQQFVAHGWQFPPSFEKQDDHAGAIMVAAETGIRQSLMVLFSTAPGERVLLPEYGCPLHLQVFDTIDHHNLALLRSLISDAVLRYERRIVLEDLQFDVSAAIEGVLQITLAYRILQTNTRSNMVFPFYLAEGRNVGQID